MELAKFILVVLGCGAVVTAFLVATLGTLISRNRRASAGKSGTGISRDEIVARKAYADSYQEQVRDEPAAYSAI